MFCPLLLSPGKTLRPTIGTPDRPPIRGGEEEEEEEEVSATTSSAPNSSFDISIGSHLDLTQKKHPIIRALRLYRIPQRFYYIEHVCVAIISYSAAAAAFLRGLIMISCVEIDTSCTLGAETTPSSTAHRLASRAKEGAHCVWPSAPRTSC